MQVMALVMVWRLHGRRTARKVTTTRLGSAFLPILIHADLKPGRESDRDANGLPD